MTKTTSSTTSSSCPCGGPDYATCCGRFIVDGDIPATAEQLMRSRYSAYVKQDAAYLYDTWADATRPATLDFDDATQWLGLQVKSHQQRDDTHAEVEFIARYKIGGRAYRLHERSRFERNEGRWRYVDGDLFERPPGALRI